MFYTSEGSVYVRGRAWVILMAFTQAEKGIARGKRVAIVGCAWHPHLLSPDSRLKAKRDAASKRKSLSRLGDMIGASAVHSFHQLVSFNIHSCFLIADTQQTAYMIIALTYLRQS
jgi:hypothetical protein